MKSPYDRIKQEAYEANMQIPEKNLAIYTFGNVSAFDGDLGVFSIKPSGFPMTSLPLTAWWWSTLQTLSLKGS